MISKSMIKSLGNLHDNLCYAEQLLKKIPGSTRASIDLPKDNCLCVVDNELVVVYNDNYHTRVAGLQIVERLEAAKHIPKLIEISLALELEIQEDIDDTCQKIEHAIAECKELVG